MLNRCFAVLCASLAIFCAVTLGHMAQQPEPSANENASAAKAIRLLTGGSEEAALAAIPADFEDVVGYSAQQESNTAVNPNGSCSSLTELPAGFTVPCQEHDLGYGLLRYADRKDEALGPWARDAIDRHFSQRLQTACGSAELSGRYAMCEVSARAASAAVGFNSWRQYDSAPVSETAGGIAHAAVGPSASSLALYSLFMRLRHNPRRFRSAYSRFRN